MSIDLSRRGLMKALAAGSAASAIPGLFSTPAFASGEVVAATYPGAFEESYRKILVPYVQKETGAQVTLTPILALDQVAKITAARSNPPFDVALLDEGPMLEALPLDIFAPFPADKSKNNGELGAPFQSKSVGPTVTVSSSASPIIPRCLPRRPPGSIYGNPNSRVASGCLTSRAASARFLWWRSPSSRAATRRTSNRPSRRSKTYCRAWAPLRRTRARWVRSSSKVKSI